jgi:hypothetical protein
MTSFACASVLPPCPFLPARQQLCLMRCRKPCTFKPYRRWEEDSAAGRTQNFQEQISGPLPIRYGESGQYMTFPWTAGAQRVFRM